MKLKKVKGESWIKVFIEPDDFWFLKEGIGCGEYVRVYGRDWRITLVPPETRTEKEAGILSRIADFIDRLFD